MKFYFLVLLSQVVLAILYQPSRVRTPVSRHNSRLFSSINENNEEEERIVQIISEGKDVQGVLGDIMQLVSKKAGVITDNKIETDEKIKSNTIKLENSFENIMNALNSSKRSELEKSRLTAEISLLYEDVKSSPDNIQSLNEAQNKRLSNMIPKTSIYSPSCAPYCIVHGPGPIGQGVVEKMKSLGKAVDVKYIEAEYLNVMQESEIYYAVRGAKTIIIAADDKQPEKKKPGLFGGNNNEDVSMCIIDSKGLKRLLNAAMNERNKSPIPYNVKVVGMDKAMKQPKSIVSFMAGDTTDFSSELILQCIQRQLGYSVLKMGRIIDKEDPYPKDAKLRSLKHSVAALSKAEEMKVQSAIPDSAVVFTSSRVDVTEVTRLHLAVDSLLRAVTYPNNNSTISVLSTDYNGNVTSDDWDGEFIKLDGPELARIPLRFASPIPTAVKLGRIAIALQQPGGGLITPIAVERFSNGVRIIFTPKESTYESAKDEKGKLKEQNNEKIPSNPIRVSGYMSPEEEEKLARLSKNTASNTANKKKEQKLEGGLEVLIDEIPHRRVRIRRCNMGPQTVVKEESEALILKALINGVLQMDNDYKVLMSAKDVSK